MRKPSRKVMNDILQVRNETARLDLDQDILAGHLCVGTSSNLKGSPTPWIRAARITGIIVFDISASSSPVIRVEQACSLPRRLRFQVTIPRRSSRVEGRLADSSDDFSGAIKGIYEVALGHMGIEGTCPRKCEPLPARPSVPAHPAPHHTSSEWRKSATAAI